MNRQPRAGPKQQRGNERQQRNNPSKRNPQTPTNVPTTTQVVPGATVSIVLKEDQPTGREVSGQVQDLLTRGNHPRGIKVRLRDGRVGRVQRMGGTAGTGTGAEATTTGSGAPRMVQSMRDWEAVPAPPPPGELDQAQGDAEWPPPRSLADFIPDSLDRGSGAPQRGAGLGGSRPVQGAEQDVVPPAERVTFVSASLKCPMCGLFEGDEAAVSHHVMEHVS